MSGSLYEIVLQQGALTDAVTSISGGVQSVADAGVDASPSISVNVGSLTDRSIDSYATAATMINASGEVASDALTSSGVAIQALSEVARDALTSSAAEVHALAEVAQDSYLSTNVSATSVADLVVVIDALTSTALSLQSIVEATIDSFASSAVQFGTLSESLLDALTQTATQAGLLAEAAQEALPGVSASADAIGESYIEALTLLSSGQQVATLLEGGGDVLSNIVLSLASAEEISVDDLGTFAVAAHDVSEMLIDLLVNISGSRQQFTEGGITVPDDFSNTIIWTHSVDDLVVKPRRPPSSWRSGLVTARSKVKDKSLLTLERQAEVIAAHSELPESYPVGAHKAYAAFQDFYGSAEGRRIFIKKALELGNGETIDAKIADVFKTGAVVDQERKLSTRVRIVGRSATVSVTRKGSPGVTILRKGR